MNPFQVLFWGWIAWALLFVAYWGGIGVVHYATGGAKR